LISTFFIILQQNYIPVLANESLEKGTSKFSTIVPGLHVIANLKSGSIESLQSHLAFKGFIETVVNNHQLNQMGSVYHDFPTGGFTAVICLAESHLSVHTWPESGYIAFDVFLSNFNNNNRLITEDIYTKVCQFFKAEILQENFIDR
jgi:S-adenosylmethionine decarboxylase